MLPLKTKSDAQVSSVWRVAYAHVCSRMLTYADVCSTIFAAAKDQERRAGVWRMACSVCSHMLAYALLYMLPLKTKSDAQVSHRVEYASIFSLLSTVLQYAAAVLLKIL